MHFWHKMIQHSTARSEIFTDTRIVKKEVVGYYYGCVVYEALMGNKNNEMFTTRGLWDLVLRNFRSGQSRWKTMQEIKRMTSTLRKILPAPFCVTRSINDEMYLISDSLCRILRTLSVRDHNVKIVQMLDVEDSHHLKSHTLLYVEALWNTNDRD